MDNLTDNELIDKMRAGDTSALGILYIRYSSAVKGFASKFIEVRQDVDDINHNIFISLWENRGKIRDIDSLKAYLFTMTRNSILKIYRHRRIIKEYESSVDMSLENQTVDFEHTIDTSDLIGMIKLKIMDMPEMQRKSFCMSRFEHKTYAEIADDLGISVKMVQYYIGKTLKELRSLVQIFILFMTVESTVNFKTPFSEIVQFPIYDINHASLLSADTQAEAADGRSVQTKRRSQEVFHIPPSGHHT